MTKINWTYFLSACRKIVSVAVQTNYFFFQLISSFFILDFISFNFSIYLCFSALLILFSSAVNITSKALFLSSCWKKFGLNVDILFIFYVKILSKLFCFDKSEKKFFDFTKSKFFLSIFLTYFSEMLLYLECFLRISKSCSEESNFSH